MLRHTSNFGSELEPLGDILDVCQSGQKRITFAGGNCEPRLRAKCIPLGSCVADRRPLGGKACHPSFTTMRGMRWVRGDIWNPGRGFYRWLWMDTGFHPRGYQKWKENCQPLNQMEHGYLPFQGNSLSLLKAVVVCSPHPHKTEWGCWTYNDHDLVSSGNAYDGY